MITEFVEKRKDAAQGKRPWL